MHRLGWMRAIPEQVLIRSLAGVGRLIWLYAMIGYIGEAKVIREFHKSMHLGKDIDTGKRDPLQKWVGLQLIQNTVQTRNINAGWYTGYRCPEVVQEGKTTSRIRCPHELLIEDMHGRCQPPIRSIQH